MNNFFDMLYGYRQGLYLTLGGTFEFSYVYEEEKKAYSVTFTYKDNAHTRIFEKSLIEEGYYNVERSLELGIIDARSFI